MKTIFHSSLLRVPKRVELRGDTIAFYIGQGAEWLSERLYVRRKVSGLILDDIEAVQTTEDAFQFAQRYGRLWTNRQPPTMNMESGSQEVPATEYVSMARLIGTLRKFIRIVNGGKVTRKERIYGAKALASRIDLLMERTSLRPGIEWDEEVGTWRYSVSGGRDSAGKLGFHDPLAPIVLYLMREVMHNEEPVACSICGDSYTPRRRPAAGRDNNYCPDCKGSPEMWRRLKAKERQQKQASA